MRTKSQTKLNVDSQSKPHLKTLSAHASRASLLSAAIMGSLVIMRHSFQELSDLAGAYHFDPSLLTSLQISLNAAVKAAVKDTASTHLSSLTSLSSAGSALNPNAADGVAIVACKKKRRMSAVGRQRIIDAVNKRWKKVRAEKKMAEKAVANKPGKIAKKKAARKTRKAR